MSKVQVLRLSEKHHAILEHMIANPTDKLGDVAAQFDVSQSWLSVLIHSDTFQEELRKKHDEVFHPAQLSLQERLTGLAHLALDKLGEEIDNGKCSAPVLLETSSSVLDRLGYGPKSAGAPAGPTQNNYYIGSVPSNVLHDARENFGTRAKRVDEQEEVVNAETTEANRTIPAQLEASRNSSEGGTD